MKNADIQRIEKTDPPKGVFNIRWRVTTLCNYQCAFCIQGDREEHLRQSEGESARLRGRICDAILELIEREGHRYRAIDLGLIGGEVTILKEFPDLLEKLAASRYEGDLRFSITTNFSADPAYLRRMLDQFRRGAGTRRRKLSIQASFYSEYVTLEQFSQKLRELSACAGAEESPVQRLLGRLGMGKSCRVSLAAGIPIVDDRDFEEYVKTQDAFRDTQTRIYPIIIRNYDTSLSPENLKRIIAREKGLLKVTDTEGGTSYFPSLKALGAALDDTDSFCPTGYSCDAGIHNIWIDAFGNVKRCPALGSTMSMGNLLDGSFRLFETPQVCTSEHCRCGVYGKIEKKDS